MYKNQKDAVSDLMGISKAKLKKVNAFGMENDGLLSYGDRIFKISSSKAEFLIAKRLIGETFKNVVNIYSANECDILGKHKKNVWKSYIIEQEKLKRVGKSFAFGDFELQTACLDPMRRIPYFAGVLNGIAELASIGITYYDLHPLNVMYDEEEQPKIIDFGYAALSRIKDNKKIKVSCSIES